MDISQIGKKTQVVANSMSLFKIRVHRELIVLLACVIGVLGSSAAVASGPSDVAVLKACGRGDAEALRGALRSGGDPKVVSSNGVPAIAFAIDSQKPEVVSLLLAADPSASNQNYVVGKGIQLSPLLDAIYKKQHDTMRALIKAGADVHWNDGTGPTLVEAAISGNDVEALRMLVESGVDPKKLVTPYGTLLHLAAVRDQPEIIEALIGYGVNVNERNDEGITPLDMAVDVAQFGCARALLKAGAWPYPTDAFGLTAVGHARQFIKDAEKSEEMVKLLASYGAPANGRNREVDERYLRAIERGELAGVKAALSEGADVDARLVLFPMKSSPVRHAAALAARNAKILGYLIEKGVNVMARDSYQFTALHFAAGQGGDLQSIRLLVENGLDVNRKSKFGETALGVAVNGNHPSAVELLLKLGADPNARAVGGGNLLQMARSGSRSKLIAPMLQKAGAVEDPAGTPEPCDAGAKPPQACAMPFFIKLGNYKRLEEAVGNGMDINERDEKGRTLLYLTLQLPKGKEETLGGSENFFNHVVANRIKFAHLLIDKGIDVSFSDYKGVGALHIAAADPRLADLIGKLIAKGADPNSRSALGEVVPLLYAVNANNLKGAQALLKHGAKPDEATTNGLTALKLATNKGQVEMIELLLKSAANPDFDAGAPPSPRQISKNSDSAIQALFDAAK